jgi:hypothetical protein
MISIYLLLTGKRLVKMRGSKLIEAGIAASSDKQYWSDYDPPRSQHNGVVIMLRRFGDV